MTLKDKRLTYTRYFGIIEKQGVINMEYNVYCDESCYMLNKDGDFMVIGAIYCPKNKTKEITKYIWELKEKHNIKKYCELKWTKISKSKEEFYNELIKYFFIENDLKFRAIICDKRILDHNSFNQTHDEWYHKMYYDMLKYIFNKPDYYNIYADIKDSYSYHNFQKVLEYLRFKIIDKNNKTLLKMQPIRSNESTLLQLSDIFVGALTYHFRKLKTNESKLNIIQTISSKNIYGLEQNTPYKQDKFNILIWNPNK